ncbi:Nrg4 [Phodopus roborovskii]|uniref:Nrg4 protein n=1 Tax=Phodopus roborovskii TaxID=109678 RepID=A0AAU9ZWS2_PHORO|nr:Nrg4 [Phodopus roborovskii]
MPSLYDDAFVCTHGSVSFTSSLFTPHSQCIENYTGARCEEVFLPSASIQSKSNLSAAFVALVILVTLAIAALCFLCRKGHLQRASSVQCEVSLVERSTTGPHHNGSHRLVCLNIWSEVGGTVWKGF